eukprot:TRINITY_DN21644_c0_g1_i1.p1 TRINITY_DN21644_c0_g1~~TRINITY_DN21644_c0_g1_i1.p1  ORF type:complete len:635 (+),score=137.61 TRINITY_DN21644_c0_g1_i1:1121-3025(+)
MHVHHRHAVAATANAHSTTASAQRVHCPLTLSSVVRATSPSTLPSARPVALTLGVNYRTVMLHCSYAAPLHARARVHPHSLLSLLLLALLLNAAAVARAPARTHSIIAVRNAAHFHQLTANPNFTFVKFFHPRCPHCRALRAPFQSLAQLVLTHNRNRTTARESCIALAEVDASDERTEPLVRKYSPSGFPTLKLYRAGAFVAEYFGRKRVSDMFDFLTTATSAPRAPLMHHLRSVSELHAFIPTLGERSLVLSTMPPSEHFMRTAAVMRSSLSPTTAFATVQHASMLLPNHSHPELHALLARYARLPHAAAIPDATMFPASLRWWFPNVRDSQSLPSFMYTAVRELHQPIQLSLRDAPLVLQSELPMLLAFGATDTPSWDDLFFLAHADVEPPALLPVYMHVSNFLHFARYVTLNTSNLTRWNTQYVVYRSANIDPYISKFGDTANVTGATWLYQQRQLINQTSVHTVAGELNMLNHMQLQCLLKYDARAVLLLLYTQHCAKCHSYASQLKHVAKRLEAHAGFIVVAAVSAHQRLPSVPEVSGLHDLPRNVPLIVWLSAGERVHVYDGVMSVNAISRYARQRAAVRTRFDNALEWNDVLSAYVLLMGVMMILVAMLLSRASSQRRFAKRFHAP